MTPAPKPQQSRKELLSLAAEESTCHGLSRTVGDRHPLLRLLWGLAVLTMLCVFIQQFVDACNRLISKPVSTSILPNEGTFVFPDVHICSVPIISASYASLMSQSDRNFTETLLTKIVSSVNSMKINVNILYLTAQILVGSLPYSFLSRNFGMRKEQSVIGALVMPVNKNLQLDVDIVDLHHHKYLNCFTVRAKDQELRNMLDNVLGYLDLTLYTDATYNQSEILRYLGGVMDIRGLNFGTYEPLISSGFRIFLTREGHYPDDYSPSLTVSPGFQHHISLSMFYTKLTSEKDQCVDGSPSAVYLDQYSGKPVYYNYDLATCYAQFMNQMFKSEFGCFLPGYSPILYDNRDLDLCSSMRYIDANDTDKSTETKLNFLYNFTNGTFITELVNSMRLMMELCRKKQPCNEATYVSRLSSILFPLSQTVSSELYDIFQSVNGDRLRQNYSLPGRMWLQRLFQNSTNVSWPEVVQAVKENVLRLQIHAGELTSPSLQVSYSRTAKPGAAAARTRTTELLAK